MKLPSATKSTSSLADANTFYNYQSIRLISTAYEYPRYANRKNSTIAHDKTLLKKGIETKKFNFLSRQDLCLIG